MNIIVLDRDGVINQDSPNFIKYPSDWHAISGSLEAIAKLNHAGYKVVVATNQSGIARGYFTQSELDAIHNKMIQQLAQIGGHLDGIFVCPHGPNDNCACRKPKPGLLLQIAEHFATTPGQILAVGDSIRDLQAAKAAGCVAVLVRTGNGEITINSVAANVLGDGGELERAENGVSFAPFTNFEFISRCQFASQKDFSWLISTDASSAVVPVYDNLTMVVEDILEYCPV